MNLRCQAAPNGQSTVKIFPTSTLTYLRGGSNFSSIEGGESLDQWLRLWPPLGLIYVRMYSGHAFVSEAAENLHAVPIS